MTTGTQLADGEHKNAIDYSNINHWCSTQYTAVIPVTFKLQCKYCEYANAKDSDSVSVRDADIVGLLRALKWVSA